MKIVAGSGLHAKNVRRVAWLEGAFPDATLVLEIEWGTGVADCPDVETLQTLTEGTLIRHDGAYACVLEYAFDSANYPLKLEPAGENLVFLLTDCEIVEIRNAGKWLFKVKQSDPRLQNRIAKICMPKEEVA